MFARTDSKRGDTEATQSLLGKEEHISVKRTFRHWLVGPIAFFYVSGYIMSFNVFAQFIFDKIKRTDYPNVTIQNDMTNCNVNKSSETYKVRKELEQKSAQWQMYISLAGSIIAVFSNLVLGSYTDRFGRKFLFYIGTFGSLLRTCLVAAAMYWDLNRLFYIIPFTVEGFSGTQSTILQVTFIYVADLTKRGKQRSFGIVLMELSFGLAGASSGFGSGYAIKWAGFFGASAIAAGFYLMSLLLVFILPETFVNKRTYTPKLQNLKDAIGFYSDQANSGKRWIYIVTLLIYTLCALSFIGSAAIEPLYQLSTPFCWTPLKIGWFSALRIGCQQVVGMLFVKPLQMRLSDKTIAVISAAFSAATYTLEGVASNDVMLYLVTVVGTGGNLTIPMIRSIMSCLTPPDKQGAIFSTMSAMNQICNVFSNVLTNTIYSATTSVFSGTVFIIFAGLQFVNVLLLLMLIYRTRTSDDNYSRMEDVPEINVNKTDVDEDHQSIQ
ncbi:hypothetical protein ACJMK2_035882 [Sinanodonta woodiana]|uniref:Major facilitator superfamily (MFS) profile domain-containing protein n=1 Tax=Sinanodonta woodiana TaxID=1069815 RepID=A0ABD3WGM6_SINWO